MNSVVSITYKFLISDRDRHGNVRYYVRRKGVPKVRIKGAPGSAEFEVAYREAVGAVERSEPAKPVQREGTWRWLCVRYLQSASHNALHPSTQRARHRALQDTWHEPRKKGAAEVFGDMPLARMDERVVAILRDRKAGTPEAANDLLKAIRRVFSWAKESGLVTHNPTRDVRRIRTSSEGHHSWTAAEVEAFKERHQLGTKAHLALMLFLLTGVRRSDAVKLGRQHEGRDADGNKTLAFTATKNKERKPVRVEIPLLPDLQRVIEASTCGRMTYLTTEYGRPFSVAGFGNWFRDRCNEAGLPHCSAHGLRKAAATAMADNGASEHQMMSVFAWLTPAEAQRYTRAASRKKLAASGAPLLVRR